jgi:regulator of sigma E protease
MTNLTNLPNGWAAVFWGVITFSILIVLHEGGHFLAARAFGLKVHEFMLGLPSPGLRWRSRRSGVTYGVTVLPLGGYVRIAGMEPGHEDELLAGALGQLVEHSRMDASDLASLLAVPRERASALLTTLEDYGAAEAVEDSMDWVPLVAYADGEDEAALLARVRSTVYRGLPTWKRVTVLAMGVLVNIVSAILILTLALTLVGIPKPTTTLAGIAVGGPAAAAGMRAGDRITAIAGVQIAGWDQLRAQMARAKPGAPVIITIVRGSATLPVSVVPTVATGGGGYLGVTSGLKNVPMGLGPAVAESFAMVGAVFVAIGRFFNPATFQESLQGARSVVGISYEVASAAEQGPLAYAWMVALLSLSLGIMNMLPIPPLDGGKIALELGERLFGRRVPRKVSIAFSVVGTLLLFSLIFYLMYADVVRYIIKG